MALPFVSSIFTGLVVVYIKDMEDEIPDTKCKEIYCEVCRHNIRNWGGQSISGECLNYIGEKMLHAMYAWGIGKAGLEKILRKLGT